ncbi:hypothetical protein SAMN04488505_103488 [Chitinophaga rupis]|uniref:Uncharacterized protein n=1 Tax=Chitinophaga rupis TaxID=573321 RepID=A0A1H7VYZ5_9BACT|nr:hypothetical protein [Chitinophaga rupis]SEM14015.1 hypothetical protein SAMN04488505_103488 [Chitinophaga rupis]
MKANSIRNFLGLFYLGTTTLLGAFILIFGESRNILPISKTDANSSFQIIIPTFIAQLTIIFRWYASPPKIENDDINIPRWVVIAPPILALLILIGTILLIAADNGASLEGGQIFKNIVTFIVSILGATTVFIVARVFGEAKKDVLDNIAKSSVQNGGGGHVGG